MADLKTPPFAVTSHTSSKFIVLSIFYPIASLCVGLRLWVRTPTLSDWLILFALFTNSALVGILWWSCIWAGAGLHTADIAPQYQGRIFIAFTVAQPGWGLATTVVKLSIIHLYMTMFPSPKFRRICYITTTITLLYFLSVVIETFAFCTPVAFNWDKTIKGTCSPNAQIGYQVAAVCNLLLDVVVVALPIPVVWSLRMPIQKKRAVIGIFSLGGAICILSIVRCVYVSQIEFTDFHYYWHLLEIYSALEPLLGTIAACMPVLRPALSRLSRTPLVAWTSSWTHRTTTRDDGSSEENLTRSRDFRNTTHGSAKGQFTRIADSVDRMYPLCDIKVGDEDQVDGQPGPDKNVRITTTITTSTQTRRPEQV